MSAEDRKFLIWSEEHGAWWCPKSKGYTNSIRKAGRYTREQAKAILIDANRYCTPKNFNEIAILEPHRRNT